MAKVRSWIGDYAVYLAVRILVCIVQMLSLQRAMGLAHFVAWLAYHVNRRHRQVALDNLKHAFGDELTDLQRDRMVKAVYLHFCSLMMEIILLPRKFNPHTWRQHVKLKDGKKMADCVLSGRPLLIVTGHFGNWEMGGYYLGLMGVHIHAVARPLDNPYLDALLRSFRERTGQRVLAKHGDFDQMQDLMASGGVLATLADQDAGQRGLFVDFFGRAASTHKAIALMALEFRVPIIVAVARKTGWPMRYEMVADEVILPEDFADRPDAVRAITQQFTMALEQAVREAPEQYFWLHRRWKHQPQKKKAKTAA
jgi:KDO2-lipid IV(A) lauroyltransferase